MPRTLFDKIWDSHLVARRADGRDLIYIDRHVLHELHAPHAFDELEKQRRPVRRPDLTFSMQDHTVATKPGRDDQHRLPSVVTAPKIALRYPCDARISYPAALSPSRK